MATRIWWIATIVRLLDTAKQPPCHDGAPSSPGAGSATMAPEDHR